jgi:hypothetical protein
VVFLILFSCFDFDLGQILRLWIKLSLRGGNFHLLGEVRLFFTDGKRSANSTGLPALRCHDEACADASASGWPA